MPSKVWSGHLTFGLVSIPVEVVTAARRKTIDLDLLHAKDHSRIRQVLYCQAEDKPLDRSEIVKGFEYEKGRYVVLEQKEIDAIKPPSAKSIEILEFVDAAEVDPVYLDTSYYLLPAEGGEKPYALLYSAMHSTRYYAVAKITMHEREYTTIVRCGEHGFLMHTMYYANEVKEVKAFQHEPKAVSQKELTLAKALIENLSDKFDPSKYENTYLNRLEQAIQSKAKGKKIVAAPAATKPKVIDIMEALQKSLKTRKPVRKVVAKKRKAS
ncbi:MAG: Ku protein [Acidobacteria bacterium]|nr:Ku protein [Acidobacteriota bacterium]